MPDLQRYPGNLNLIKKMWKIPSFSYSKIGYSNVSIESYKQKMRKVTFAEKPQMKINSLKKKNIDI